MTFMSLRKTLILTTRWFRNDTWATRGVVSLAQEVGEVRLSALITAAGFGSVRRATQGPFNMVLEARP
jgi:hypothetical protein